LSYNLHQFYSHTESKRLMILETHVF